VECSTTYKIGDTRELIAQLEGKSIHLIVTSPPYWNAKDYSDTNQIGFSQTYNKYIEDLEKIWKHCERILVPNGKICINLQPMPVSKEQTNLDRSSILDIMCDIQISTKNLGLELSNIIIWDKRKYNNQKIFGSYPYPPNMYSHISFEYIYVFRKPGSTRKLPTDIKELSKISLNDWKNWCFNSIWDIAPVIKFGAGDKKANSHIAPFPLEIPRRLIKLFSFVGDTVLDPFLGAGTTLAACQLENRNGIGFELQRDYEQLIKAFIASPQRFPRYAAAESETNNQQYKLNL
tara:strand:- start:2979 stop:3848 length:870 start_codon:yes stop_codon:yes gene_type:complete